MTHTAEAARTADQDANIHILADFFYDTLDSEDYYENGYSSIKIGSWGENLIKEVGNTNIDDRADRIIAFEERSAWVAGYAVALLSAPEKITEILSAEGSDQEQAIQEEAKRLLGLSDSQAHALFFPWQVDIPIVMSMAIGEDLVWPSNVAYALRLLSRENKVDWYKVFASEEVQRVHEESGLIRLPSDVFQDHSLKVVSCAVGCNADEEGICLLDTIRQGFGIRDHESVVDAIEGKLWYVSSGAAVYIEEFIEKFAEYAVGIPISTTSALEQVVQYNDEIVSTDPIMGGAIAVDYLTDTERWQGLS